MANLVSDCRVNNDSTAQRICGITSLDISRGMFLKVSAFNGNDLLMIHQLRIKVIHIVAPLVLALSGLLLTFVGAVRMHRPIKSLCLQTYVKEPGTRLEDDVDMLNEIRGIGTVTLFGGLTILAGIVFPGFKPTSFGVAVVIFLGFAVGRALSMALDGKPNSDLVKGTIAEVVLSALNIVCLVTLLT